MANESKPEEKGKEIQKAGPTRPLSPFDEMERMMDRMFEGFMPRGWLRPMFDWPSLGRLPAPFEGRMPSVDVVDRENEVVVRAEVPGVEKKDLEVSLGDNTVTIKGTMRREEKEEKGDYYRREISSGSFTRTVALPAEVDGSRAKATFKDGVLELVLPKAEHAKRRSINIE
jgi:HSP20 family protein